MWIQKYPGRWTIASKVKGYEKFLSKELDIEIGKTLSELDSRKKTVRTEEAAIGNLIADAMRDGVDADIGLANGGGIRAKKIYAPWYHAHTQRHFKRTSVW